MEALNVLKKYWRAFWRTSPETGKCDIGIVSKLNEAGLDGEYWANVLESKLSVTKFEHIANLKSEKDLKKLTACARNESEIAVITKLFNCTSEEDINDPTINYSVGGGVAELANSNISATEEREVDITDLKNIALFQYEHTEDGESVQTADSGIAAEGEFNVILNTLGLSRHYPSKISVSDAITIKNAIEHPKLVDIPWMILKKLITIDFRARDQPFSEVNEAAKQDESAEHADVRELDLNALIKLENVVGVVDKSTCISTLDVLVALFACCDNFLKQIVAQKLFICKLAIPFLYPLGSEEKVCMSLWALRTIIVECNGKSKEASETPVTEGSFPLVTFIRLGRPPISKSKLLNNVLRDDSHDTFFHEDCDNGIVARRIADGLVECSWFIPSGKKTDHLPLTTMFLNVRGDASKMKRQLQILQEISTVIFVLVTAKDLAKYPNTDKCRQLLQSSAKVILFLITNGGSTISQELRSCRDKVGENFLNKIPVILSTTSKENQKNASELKTEARRKISEALNGCLGISLEDCAKRAIERGVIVDEYHDEACIEGKKNAEKALKNLEGEQIEQCRFHLLPLQGTEWIEYSELLKRQHRSSGKGSQESSAYYADRIKKKMVRLRKKQVEMCKGGLPPFIKDFISGLLKKEIVVMYFLKWMGLLLDGKSRSTLPDLRREYYQCWTNFQEAKKDGDKKSLEKLSLVVNNAEHKLANASLGLENLFRELGQVYEAMQEGCNLGKETREGAENLAYIAAKLLLHGIPFELVDGDAASVPITWVCAVLNKVEELIGKKKVFVISVLGIQSSGKSTLLNTMFGLQFAVSAGRCTRGAYMQLIPVDEKAGFKFDYIVVVDTEGLRAPELGTLKYEHDNELATLVIGLGDVTLINIKGENTAEIKDILQIAVHAFLRMNLVKKNIKDNRTCVFIHQNVPATNADELMRHGCQKLKESLDDMTKEAALSEEIADIHSFSQIIKFDIEKHVWYFSDLWHGNPPMAPANPGYSEKVTEVKLNLLAGKVAEQKTFLTASKLSIRLADLWNGVLADDFVFSFRNSLEVTAYNSLQSKYHTLEWELQSELKSWLDRAEIDLKICETKDDLESTYQSLVCELPKVLITKTDEIKKSLQNYFDECELRDIVVQWQQSKMNELQFAAKEQQREGKTYLLSIKEVRLVEILHSREWLKQKDYIKNKAVELADNLRGKKLSDAEFEKQFNDMWVPMVDKLATETEEKESRIDIVMERILYQRLYDQGHLLKQELRQHPLTKPLGHTSLKKSITTDFVRNEHISVKRMISSSAGSVTKEDAIRETKLLTHCILNEIDDDLRGLTHDMKFQNSYAAEIINKIVNKIAYHNSQADCNFTILHNFVVKLVVHVSRYCVQVFSFMQSEYIKRHGFEAKLQAYKAAIWSLFKNTVKDATEEVLAGDLLCTHLKQIVQNAVTKATPRKCADEIIRGFASSKYAMLMEIMDDLAVKAENGKFNDYMSFIFDAKTFALQWLKQYTNEKMFDTPRYATITKGHIADIMQCITNSVSHATSEVEGRGDINMAMWIKKFCGSVSKQIPVPTSDLSDVSDRAVIDFKNLQRIVFKQLKEIQAELENTFANISERSVDWDGSPPQKQVLDKIWGCPEQCPFCHEPCADTTPNHLTLYDKAHMCVQHRPEGLTGVKWKEDKIVDGIQVRKKGQLCLYACNYSVQMENVSFLCSACEYRCRDSGKCPAKGTEEASHSNLEYKTYLPDWDIAPDRTNSVSKYWMWVMATYRHQLKDIHKAVLPDIPNSWMSLTKEDALKDLRKVHH